MFRQTLQIRFLLTLLMTSARQVVGLSPRECGDKLKAKFVFLVISYFSNCLLFTGNQESVPRVLLQSGKVSRESQQKQIQRCQSM